MKRISLSVILALAALGVGVGGFYGLSLLRKAPAAAEVRERALEVEAVRAEPTDVRVTITGSGEVEVIDVVTVAPEVSGRVVEVHPRLDPGEVIPEGEVLFRIDPATYEARVAQARASVAQAESALARLRTEYEDDRARLKTLERTRDLARAEYDRLRKLFEEDEVGTQSGVEQAEQAYNQARDTVDQLRRTLSVYPIRIDEAEATLAAARAQLDERTIDLERTVVRAPFDARIKARSVEAGQFVNVAQQLLTLADDSVLEIPVELYSLDARRWLEFGAQHRNGEGAWFANLAQVPVKIRWTEDKDGHVWEGILHRVEEFNPDTRTLTVRVRVTEEQAMSDEGDMLPLVEGMYCTVEIPGRVVEDVIRLPHWAVSFEDTVYVVDEKNRLATRPVEVVRETEDSTLISAGVAPGELVVTTRLVDPLENTLLDPKVEGLEAATEDPPEALDDTGAPEETV